MQPQDGPVSLHPVERAGDGVDANGPRGGKPTVYLQDDLVETSGQENAVLPPGINRLGKRKFLRNDFMGSAYNGILSRVQSDMKSRALQDAHLGVVGNGEGEKSRGVSETAKKDLGSSLHFNNEAEKRTAYQFLQNDLASGSLNTSSESDTEMF